MKAPVALPQEVGQVHRQLQQPLVVGEITASQAREIKALNDLTTRLEQDAVHAQRVLVVAQMHKREFLRQLLVERELDTKHSYNIDDDSGIIRLTHELVTTDALEVVAVPSGEEA